MSSDATAVIAQKQPLRKAKGRWTRMATLFACLAAIAIFVTLFFAFWIVGVTQGREFDAATWTFRSFTFVRNPFTGNQFSGIRRTNDFSVPANITSHIRGGPLAPGERWDLVEIYKGPSHYVGDAQILLDYLSALDQRNTYYWEVWTTDHPGAAPILWAAVRDCVHLPRYDRLPDIFEAARTTTQPDKLTAKLKPIMLDIAEDEAKLQAALGNDQAKQRAEKLKAAYLQSPATNPEARTQAEVEQIQ